MVALMVIGAIKLFIVHEFEVVELQGLAPQLIEYGEPGPFKVTPDLEANEAVVLQGLVAQFIPAGSEVIVPLPVLLRVRETGGSPIIKGMSVKL